MKASKSLLEEYNNIIQQCKQMKLEVEADFWVYKEKVTKEWNNVVAEREEIERNWKTMDKNTQFGMYTYVSSF
jgi:hypothetical protein